MVEEFVRIRVENGREVSVSKTYLAHLGDDVEFVDAPATNPRGAPTRETRRDGRRAVPKTTVEKEAAKKAAKQAADDEAEASAPSEPGESTTTDGVAVVQPQEASE